MSQNKRTVDARGKLCPEPVVMTKKSINSFPGEELLVLVDSPVAKENVSRLAKKNGYGVTVDENDGEYQIKMIP